MPRTLSPGEIAAFKQRLVTAAEGLIVRRGSLDFTMRELATEVGCSPMLPYRYFADKDDLTAAVRTAVFSRFAAALESARALPGETAAVARGVGEAYVRFALANPMLYRLMFDMVGVARGRYPDLDAAGARARETMTGYVRDLIGAGLLVGEPVVVGHLFWAALHGLLMLKLSGQLDDAPGFDALRTAMQQALVFGLAPR